MTKTALLEMQCRFNHALNSCMNHDIYIQIEFVVEMPVHYLGRPLFPLRGSTKICKTKSTCQLSDGYRKLSKINGLGPLVIQGLRADVLDFIRNNQFKFVI